MVFNKNLSSCSKSKQKGIKAFKAFAMENSDGNEPNSDQNSHEKSSSHSQLFNAEFATHHSYLGTTENVRGTFFFEPYKTYEISIFGHHSLVFPGEIFPMIIPQDRYFSSDESTEEEGLVFGLVFQKELDETIYGVTCQIFEKGSDNQCVRIKAKAQQRFVVVKDSITLRSQKYMAKVKILPEIFLEDPSLLSISNNLRKHLNNSRNNKKELMKLLAASTAWPRFVFEDYSLAIVTEKIDRYIAMLNIEAPTDVILKSFWLARNIPLNHADKLRIFMTDCVNKRLIFIGESLNYMYYFLCKQCQNKIAIYNDIFAMSKDSVNANYCNPHGYIHETLTVKKTFESAVELVDRPSTEFSWFPGYAWQITICSSCTAHVGWKFTAVSNHTLRPSTFFGLSCKSLLVQSEQDMTENEVDSE